MGRNRVVLKGNLTIEASIIMPVILIVLCILIMCTLGVHDLYVMKSYNRLQTDAYVITGQEDGTGYAISTFMGVLNQSTEYKDGLFENSAVSNVTSRVDLLFWDYSIDLDESISGSTMKPKAYIRGIDLVDDASDLWSVTREVKDKIREDIEGIETIVQP